MVRIEIIANQSVEEDMIESLYKVIEKPAYTKINGVHGRGNTYPKRGDNIWPEENIILIIYCEADEALKIKEAVYKVKKQFPDEGIKYFELRGGLVW
jgi:hypothetical protein